MLSICLYVDGGIVAFINLCENESSIFKSFEKQLLKRYYPLLISMYTSCPPTPDATCLQMIDKWYIVLELIHYSVSFLLYGYLCKTSTIDSLLSPPLKRLDYEFRVHVPIYFRGSKNVYFKDTNNVYFFFDMYLGLRYPFKVIYLEMKCVYITVDDTRVLTFTVLRGAIHFEYKTVRLRSISSYFID